MFQEGRHFVDGGWFETLTVQVRQAGVWVAVPGLLTITPAYPGIDDGESFETYTLDFSAVTGDGIRIYGPPGGFNDFISVGELEVFGAGTGTTNTPPVPTITAPTAALAWQVNDVIAFSGGATDVEDGTLPATALSWSVILNHCTTPTLCHQHGIQDFARVASGSFTAPDHEYPAYLELRLTATDSGGRTGTTSLRLDPRTVPLTFASNPSGMQIVVDGAGGATPFSRTAIVGSTHSLSAATPQTLGTTSYGFGAWSDGGAASHNVVAGSAAATYTASYVALPTAPTSLTATAISSTRIDLAWTDTTTVETGFKIERQTGAGAFSQIATVGPNVTTFSNTTGLSAGTAYTYRVRATNAGGNSPYSNTAAATTTPGTGGLPAPWTSADIGSVQNAGSATFANGTFTVRASGADIWGFTDAFRFTYQHLTGDGQITARVTAIQNTDPWAKAGVMMRETLAPGSRHGMMVLTALNGVAFQRRTSTGGTSTHTGGGAASAPYWVRMTRTGNVFQADKSSNGTTWTQVGTVTIAMPSTIYVGLALTAHDPAINTSTFDNVTRTP